MPIGEMNFKIEFIFILLNISDDDCFEKIAETIVVTRLELFYLNLPSSDRLSKNTGPIPVLVL
jgi:hypothetical protein